MPYLLPTREQRAIYYPERLDYGLGRNRSPVHPLSNYVDLPDLLTNTYYTDAHIAPYDITYQGDVIAPNSRLAKDALPALRALGGEVIHDWVILDLDLKHLPVPDGGPPAHQWGDYDDPVAVRNALLAKVPYPASVIYCTRGGFKFIHALTTPVPAGYGFELLAKRIRMDYVAAGLPIDPDCKDWTHLYRAPRVVRDGVPQHEQPWYWATDHYLDDPASYVTPKDDELRVYTEAASAQIQDVEGRPDDAEVAEWLASEAEFIQTARMLFRGDPLLSVIDGTAALTETRDGDRNNRLKSFAGIVVSKLLPHKLTVEQCYAFVRRASLAFVADQDWATTAWNLTCHAYGRELATRAKVAADFEAAQAPAPPPPPLEIGSPASVQPPAYAPVEPIEADADDEVVPPDSDPAIGPDDEGEYALTQAGQIVPCARNVRVALRRLGVLVEYDEFSERVLLSGPGASRYRTGAFFNDSAANALWVACAEREALMVPRDRFFIFTEEYARRRRRHPVREYLDSLTWDGAPRLDSWTVDYLGAEDTEFNRVVGRLTLLAAARRVRQPGAKFDEMLLLEGHQGSMKSSVLKVLAVREEWFCDDLPLGSTAKEVIEQTRGKWIIEAADLQGMGNRSIDELKAFLSRTTDRARLAYERTADESSRQFIVIGTTNSNEYLVDFTGNRRFWPMRTGEIRFHDLKRDRDQLWAEVAVREASGEGIRLPVEMYEIAAQIQSQRQVEDPMAIRAEELIGDRTGFLLSKELGDYFGVAERFDVGAWKRLGKIMGILGWEKYRSNRGRGYLKMGSGSLSITCWRIRRLSEHNYKLEEDGRL